MADTQKTTRELKIETAFADGDTRTITVSNPRVDLTIEDVQTLANAAANVLIGDRNGAAFAAITKVSSVTKETTEVDLK